MYFRIQLSLAASSVPEYQQEFHTWALGNMQRAEEGTALCLRTGLSGVMAVQLIYLE